MVTNTGLTLLLFGAVFFVSAIVATDYENLSYQAWVAVVGIGGLAMFGLGLLVAGVGTIWGI